MSRSSALAVNDVNLPSARLKLLAWLRSGDSLSSVIVASPRLRSSPISTKVGRAPLGFFGSGRKQPMLAPRVGPGNT